MTNRITIDLTEDQAATVADIIWHDAYNDLNEQTRAYKLRIWNKLAKAKTL